MEIKSTKFVTEAENEIETNDAVGNKLASQHRHINPQVKATTTKSGRRRFSQSQKTQLIQSFDACADATERGAFLRQNGLYYSTITKWKTALSNKTKHQAHSKAHQALLANQQLQRENTRLKKQLARAEAIIDLQKKVSALLSINALDPEASETSS